MKKLLVAIALVLFWTTLMPEAEWAQGIGNVVLKFYVGAPTGSCSRTQMATDTTTGNLYICFVTGGVGEWQQVGGGGGTGTPGGSTDSTQYNAGGGNFGGTGPGNAGQVLESNGAGMAPSFQDPIVSGPTAIGSAPSATNPVFVATWDGTNIRVPLTTNSTPGSSDYALEVRNIPSGTQPVSGTVTANQGGAPWSVTGSGTAGSAASGVLSVQGIASMTPLSVTGTFFQTTQPVSCANAATCPVNATQVTSPWIVAGGGTAGSPGTAVLTIQGVGSGTAVPVSGTFFQSTQPVSCASAATCPVLATGAAASGSALSGNPVLVAGSDGTDARDIATDTSGQVKTLIENSPSVTGSGVFEVSATSSVNSASNPLYSTLTDGTTAISAAVSALGTAPTGTELMSVQSVMFGKHGSTYSPITANSGSLTFAMDANLVGVLGATMSVSNPLFGEISDGASAMGTMANFGTTPTAVKALNANASLFVGTTAVSGTAPVPVSPTAAANLVTNPFFVQVGNGTNNVGINGSSYTSTYGLNGNILGLDGAVFSATNALFGQIADGTSAMGAMANFGTGPGAVKALNDNASVYYGTVGLVADPCQSNAQTTLSINEATSSTTQIIAGSSGKHTYICSAFLISASAQNINLLTGTGTNCATVHAGLFGGTTAATGPNLAANEGWTQGGSGYRVTGGQDTSGDEVCWASSGSGQVSGAITYVQQ